MTQWAGKRYWLVGASEGLGAALAQVMSAAGVTVVLSARRAAPLEALAKTLPGPSEVVPLDLASTASVEAAAEQVGPVDGVVCLAGVYWPTPARDWDAKAVETMADVNFTGTVRLMGAVVPGMVARDTGHIVITGSLSGFRGLPGSIGYAAAKAGTMVLAEGMHCDLRKTGVRVQLVNPGFIRTRLTDKNTFAMPQIMEPDVAARRFFDHMNTARFQLSYPSPFAWVFRVGNFLPDWLYYRIFS